MIRRNNQEEHVLEIILAYIVRSRLKKTAQHEGQNMWLRSHFLRAGVVKKLSSFPHV